MSISTSQRGSGYATPIWLLLVQCVAYLKSWISQQARVASLLVKSTSAIARCVHLLHHCQSLPAILTVQIDQIEGIPFVTPHGYKFASHEGVCWQPRGGGGQAVARSEKKNQQIWLYRPCADNCKNILRINEPRQIRICCEESLSGWVNKLPVPSTKFMVVLRNRLIVWARNVLL